jgi:agmatine deiminase
MSLMGAELLFYPTAIGTEPQDATIDSRFHWQRVMQGHAGANLVPVIASNRIGKEKDIRFYGKSFIAGNLGQLVADADDSKQSVLVHTFDLNELHVQRTSWGVFRDRRPDLYTPLLSLDGSRPVPAAVAALSNGPHRGFHHHRPGHGYGEKKCTRNDKVATTGFSQLKASTEALTTPLRDGYRFPAEWEPHAGTWMLWPTRVGTWRNKASYGQAAFAEVAKAISEFEPVTVCVPPTAYVTARRQLPPRIKVIEMSQDDAWARDIGPTWIVNDHTGGVRGVDWEFNAWGGEEEGCYSDWSLDQLVKEKMLTLTAQQGYKCPFVVEGGAIHTDGQGTLLTTEECMLNPNRLLPSDIAAGIKTRTRETMNDAFRTYLGVSKVIWLPNGVFGDKDTNGHIDNIACFVAPGQVVLTWTDDVKDPQHAISSEALRILESSTDARGHKLVVHKLHQPVPQLMQKDEIEGLDQAAIGLAQPAGSDSKTSLIGGGTDMGRRVGDRMAASYVNFYIANGGIIMPAFGDRVHDALAAQKLASLFPGRRVVQVYSREILLGGGNIHCITQQEPAAPVVTAISATA